MLDLSFHTYFAPAINPKPNVAKTPAKISTRGWFASFTITIATAIKVIPDISKARLSFDFPFLFIEYTNFNFLINFSYKLVYFLHRNDCLHKKPFLDKFYK